jgi:hypothetical protein
MTAEPKWLIRNVAAVPWRQFPDHFGGALSKPLVMPETAGSRHIDYRISMYQPIAYVKVHRHKVQEQVYHVIEGEGLMHIDGRGPRGAQARRHLPAARRRSLDFQYRAGRSGLSRRDLAGDARRALTWPLHCANTEECRSTTDLVEAAA